MSLAKTFAMKVNVSNTLVKCRVSTALRRRQGLGQSVAQGGL